MFLANKEDIINYIHIVNVKIFVFSFTKDDNNIPMFMQNERRTV